MFRGIIFFLFLALVVPACKTLPSDQQAADNSDLALLWQQVDSLKEIRLPRSALKLVQQIKGRSFRSEAWPNFIKSVIYENQFLSEMEGQGLANVIERMEMELAQTQEPATSIMHSILGEAYIQYLLNNLWRLRDQLPVQDPLSTIDAMSIDELKSKAITHHLQALNSDTLSVIPIQDYAIILQPDSLKDSRWETLFDLIANRSLDFFSTDYAFVTEPLSARELDEEFYFAATQSFASREIEMPSGLVSRFLAIQLYQRLLNQHLNDSDPSRLVELDLRRLKYVSDHSTHQDKEGLFIRALSSLSDQYRGHQAYAEIRFAEANQLLRNEKDSLSRVHAFDICSEAATRFPNSYGAIQCQNLMTKILSKSLQVECEKVVLPGEYNLIKIHYRNFSSVHLRVARLSDEEYWQLAQLDRESVISRLISLEVIEDAHYELPLPADFRQHSVEMILPPLAVGRYVLLIGSDSKFSLINNAVSVSFFQVSKLSFSEVRKSRSSYFICTNRKTGEALQNVEIAWMQRVSGREGEWKEIEGTYSDQNGIFHLMDSRHSLQVKLNYGNDSLWLDDRYISVRSPEMIQHRQVVYFFTDRSIYRPGQLIYFKGLALRFDAEGIPSLLKNRTVEASLRDVNGQDVSKATFRTNKFGSFHGSFRIPASGLKGSMSLGTDIGNQRTYFQVEAYKRPRFYVELDSLQQSAALGDTVWVNGRALGFAGFAVTDAEVTFRVLRSRVLRPWGGGWERGGFSYSPVTTQITQGTVTTDSSGRFSLDFVAADDPISFPSDSEFRFDVQVDVMDIAGETQSKLRSYVIGTEPFRFVIEMSSEWELGEPKLLRYRSINGDGAPIETSGTLTIERLSSTNRFVRRRYWTAPDQKYVSDKELQTLLPKDEWADELNPEHWPVTDTLETISLKGGEGELNLVDHGFIPGVYRLTTQVSDTHGHQVSETAYANVYAPDANYIPWQDAVWMSPGKKQYQPGDTATFWLASHDSISVWMECSQGDDVRQWFTFDGWKKLEIPVLPEDRGGFSVSVLCVYENRCTTWTTQVEVPWSNKSLEIQVSTWRDQMAPGQSEEVSITVQGEDANSVSAELLLGMYDISLDQFTNHEWPSTFYPFHRPWIQIRPAAFGRTRGRHYEDSWNESPIAQKARIYPVINWFGWNKFYGYPERRTMAASDAVLAESPLENAEKTKMDNLESETVESDTRASPIRDDLEETLFFFPDVHTDSTGSLTFSFVMNDAVTTWRFMAFAHTSDLSVGYKELKTISQKPLMILPNAPRFLRRSDTMQIMGRMVNLSANAIVGVASLDFLNPIDESTITQELLLSEYKQDIALAAGEIQEVTWQIHVPKHLIMPVSYAMKVESEGYSDGESSLLPVLQDRILLSESAAFQTDANSKEIYVLDKLKDLMKEETQIVDCSIESVSSPIWHAVLSLPYLLEYPFECTEQIFSRYYANAMASHLLQEYPAIGAAIRSWKETDALQSPLYKNQEVKSAILTETPWVQDALADSEQRARLAHLLEKNQVDRGLYQAITKLDQLQLPNGGFSWFAGGRDHWFITQHLMEGFAQLQFLSLIDRSTEPFRSMIGKAIDYLDQQAVSFYNEIEREVVTGRALFEDNHLNSLLIHYLYTRSLWEEDYPLDMDAKIPAFFNDQAAKYWNQYPLYSQAQLAFVFYRQANTKLADVLLRSFRERVAIKEDFAFWPESYSHAWDRLPMETHIVLLRLFSTHTNDQQLVDALKSYLIRQKRVNRWTSTKSTTAAVYALVTTGTPWIDVSRSVDIHIGTQKVSPSTGLEWGSLYWKESIRDIVTADKSAEITVTNPNSSPAWIGAYWNYFQELDEVGEYGSSSLRITKDIYRSDVSDEGERLVVVDKLRPHIGDKLIVQLTIEAQEGMEFVHLKDQRASCLEPLETISRYEWKHGLGYYRSYDDASVNFFFDYLPKGKHVFQYPLRVLQSGTFAGGISTIQSMYAPEFSAHSSGSRLIIAK